MSVLLGVVQGFLAVVFLVTGMAKLTQPRLKMAAGMMSWAADVSDQQFRSVGLLEVLGAAGLIAPAALNNAPQLSGLAAGGLGLLMVGATVTHLKLRETSRLAAPIVLMALALFVAVVRLTGAA